ncbi:hypothetical protein [Paracoccus sp. ME4]|uniref:hypothetical protein n=1 Tax=Paracoccus sp. ME4 TaxID=3138066 RepID=UPI00398B6C6C
MNAMSPGRLSRKDRIEAGRDALAGLFPNMVVPRPGTVSPTSGLARRSDMRSWDVPAAKPEPVPAVEPQSDPEREDAGLPKPEPRPMRALDERTLGNLAVNTGEQALGAISDLIPSSRREPEMDAEVEDPFGTATAPAQANPEGAGRRMLEEMRLSFESLIGMGGKAVPDHSQNLEPELPEAIGEVPDIRETEVFAQEMDEPDLPRPGM